MPGFQRKGETSPLPGPQNSSGKVPTFRPRTALLRMICWDVI